MSGILVLLIYVEAVSPPLRINGGDDDDEGDDVGKWNM